MDESLLPNGIIYVLDLLHAVFVANPIVFFFHLLLSSKSGRLVYGAKRRKKELKLCPSKMAIRIIMYFNYSTCRQQ